MTRQDIARLTAPLEKQCTRDSKIITALSLSTGVLGAIALELASIFAYHCSIMTMLMPSLFICGLGVAAAFGGRALIFQKLDLARLLVTGTPRDVTLKSQGAGPKGRYRLDLRWTEPRFFHTVNYGVHVDVERSDSQELVCAVMTRPSDPRSVAVVVDDRLYIAPRQYWP